MQVESENLYAVMQLTREAEGINHFTKELPELRKKMGLLLEKNKKKTAKDIYERIERILHIIAGSIEEIILCLYEMELEEVAAYASKLTASIKQFHIMTKDYTKICTVLKGFVSKLPTNNTTNASVIGRMMNNVKLGYYPTNLEHIRYFIHSIDFPEEVTVNLLDPCCGCGRALMTLAEGNNCNTYGVELDESRAEEALTRLHRVGFGSFYYSRISNEAFHVMFLNPPYLSVLSSERNFRSEKRFLSDSIDHLMIGGLLIYIIPYYRLTEDICKIVSDNFKDIHVWKFIEDEFKKYKQIAIMGIRKKRDTDEDQKAKLYSMAFQVEDIPVLDQIPEHLYQIVNVNKKVELFKGSQFNVAELALQMKNSNSLSKLYRNKGDNVQNKRPLLPLSIGQIGLIGCSGLINGSVECDSPHIIKGRVIKVNHRHITRTEEMGKKEVSHLHIVESNKMIFNVLTPNGLKTLN